ncbi:MAG: tRNA-dihydrouridine synthase family protein [Lentisphaeria bacterium]|nr:tRNA-dihydrouridine synthase family protein [Lentisphaeria bacterium]
MEETLKENGQESQTGKVPELILAPIRGISDAVYRQAFIRCFKGFDRAMAPFVQPRRGKPLRPGERRQLSMEANCGLSVTPQVLTNNAETLLSSLRELRDLGHEEVNWNLGCPHPTTAGRGKGAGLLPHPERIEAILAYVLPKAPVRISVKLRLGYRNPDDFQMVVEVLNRHPLSEVILHPRTAAQMYEGDIDLERAEQAFRLCLHRFVHSGDIRVPGDIVKARERLRGNPTAWMLGRGVLANPFLVAWIKGRLPPDAERRRTLLRTFHDELLEGYQTWLSGPGHLLNRMKQHWDFLAQAFADPHRIRLRIRRSHDLATYANAVTAAYDQPLATMHTNLECNP